MNPGAVVDVAKPPGHRTPRSPWEGKSVLASPLGLCPPHLPCCRGSRASPCSGRLWSRHLAQQLFRAGPTRAPLLPPRLAPVDPSGQAVQGTPPRGEAWANVDGPPSLQDRTKASTVPARSPGVWLVCSTAAQREPKWGLNCRLLTASHPSRPEESGEWKSQDVWGSQSRTNPCLSLSWQRLGASSGHGQRSGCGVLVTRVHRAEQQVPPPGQADPRASLSQGCGPEPAGQRPCQALSTVPTSPHPVPRPPGSGPPQGGKGSAALSLQPRLSAPVTCLLRPRPTPLTACAGQLLGPELLIGLGAGRSAGRAGAPAASPSLLELTSWLEGAHPAEQAANLLRLHSQPHPPGWSAHGPPTVPSSLTTKSSGTGPKHAGQLLGLPVLGGVCRAGGRGLGLLLLLTSTRKRGPELDDYDFYTIPVTTRPVDHSNSSAQRRLQGDENIGTDAEERRPVKNLQRASCRKRTEDHQVPLQMHREPCVLANILGNGGYITRHQQVLDQMATSVTMTLLTTWRSQTWFRPSTGPVGLEPELCLVATTTVFEFVCKITCPGNMRTRFPPEQQVWQLVSSVKRTLHGTWNPNQARLNTGPVNIFQRASWGKRTGDLQVPLQMHREPCVLANILGNGGYITRHQQVLDQMATSVKMTLLTTWRSQTWFRPSTGPVGLEPELCLVATTTIFEFICKTTCPGNMRTRFPPEQQVWQLVSSVKRTLHGTWNPNQARLNTGPVNIVQRASWEKRTGDLQVPLQMHREPCVLANILGNGGHITRHQQVLDQKATSVKRTLHRTCSPNQVRPNPAPGGGQPGQCLESVNLSSPSTLLGNQQRVYVFLFIIFFLVFSIFLFK
ncbi:uncharacterized protein LOC143647756 [Tamandua tetradactyla]|uniref:uncharacterized protein LOC143647756 n=1 Tax=Tamandua tetradactyla TaxID=48850 RepID=UPI0040538079